MMGAALLVHNQSSPSTLDCIFLHQKANLGVSSA